MSINRAILLGHVGGDPEIRTVQSGDKIASFSLATSEQWRDKATGERRESTEWHRVVVFNQPLVGIVEQYVKKGSKVSVQGQIKTRKWQANDGSDRYSTEIVIGRFDGSLGLEGSPKGAERDEHAYGQTRAKPAREAADDPRMGMASSAPSGRPLADDLNDDIPF
ncbi:MULTISPECIES: single-stranded DNA-binding protein [Methylosinus]|uniref:Single-stranded DNA-binding protein n=1 Tax=Methylosinus trichosporium (strain ATCC 35070 / NCIMB 11131 / UNIQEM 75 / OB3b) TaxID=595536 RepID=A0A2D2D5J0_METT3|nr:MULTISPECIES: single-stranded DNA-binding protein [Methylosinus]ATQ70280.1 single-stranded DNA-binding protein [Methylosinus trichosporium OB3b]OBS51868.1 single-stranded DNA-binding protein [Methylosinus sp. 3S-1]